jgi:hypothetical protein
MLEVTHESTGPGVVEILQSTRWRCRVCGRHGKPENYSESIICMAGHPFGCSCGRWFSSFNYRKAHIRMVHRDA